MQAESVRETSSTAPTLAAVEWYNRHQIVRKLALPPERTLDPNQLDDLRRDLFVGNA
jgi:hypothetical protein